MNALGLNYSLRFSCPTLGSNAIVGWRVAKICLPLPDTLPPLFSLELKTAQWKNILVHRLGNQNLGSTCEWPKITQLVREERVSKPWPSGRTRVFLSPLCSCYSRSQTCCPGKNCPLSSPRPLEVASPDGSTVSFLEGYLGLWRSLGPFWCKLEADNHNLQSVKSFFCHYTNKAEKRMEY